LGLLLATLTTLLHAWHLGQPNAVIFDEVHFGKFLTAYCCSKERIFDIHPPHAKLMLAAAAKIAGYRGGFDFAHIGESYAGQPVIALRWLPAVWGGLAVVLVFIILRQLGATEAAAFLGSLMLALDNGMLIQTRVIALDGLLVVAILAVLSTYLASLEQESYRRKIPWLLLTGALTGLAVGTKFTGLVALALPAWAALLQTDRHSRLGQLFQVARQYIWILSAALLIYAAGWWLHFHLLQRSGPGDAFFRPSGSFLRDVSQMHVRMLKLNYHLKQTHPYGSAFWSWPFVIRPVFYWASPGRFIYLAGNPVVWLGSFLVLVFGLFATGLAHVSDLRLPRKGPAFLLLSGAFLMSYLPYAAIPRTLFIYHYLPSLPFAVMGSVIFLDRVGWIRPGSILAQRRSYYLVCTAVLLAFVALLPLTYGFNHSRWYDDVLFRFFKSWR